MNGQGKEQLRSDLQDAGERLIPLNEDAMTAVMVLYHRAQQSGATEPNHYVSQLVRMGKSTQAGHKPPGEPRGGI
jgi:hypothetical protein